MKSIVLNITLQKKEKILLFNMVKTIEKIILKNLTVIMSIESACG